MTPADTQMLQMFGAFLGIGGLLTIADALDEWLSDRLDK
jgi:hypothetical protein